MEPARAGSPVQRYATSDGRGRPCHGHGNPGPGDGPSDGRGRVGRDLHPSNPQRTALHHGEVPPSEPPHTVVESNNRHATCNAFPPDTNNRLSTRTLGLGLAAEPGQHGAAVVGQF